MSILSSFVNQSFAAIRLIMTSLDLATFRNHYWLFIWWTWLYLTTFISFLSYRRTLLLIFTFVLLIWNWLLSLLVVNWNLTFFWSKYCHLIITRVFFWTSRWSFDSNWHRVNLLLLCFRFITLRPSNFNCSLAYWTFNYLFFVFYNKLLCLIQYILWSQRFLNISLARLYLSWFIQYLLLLSWLLNYFLIKLRTIVLLLFKLNSSTGLINHHTIQSIWIFIIKPEFNAIATTFFTS